MHILLVADADSRYGASHSMYQMTSELLKLDKGLKISVVLPRNSPMAGDFRALGCAVYCVAYWPFQRMKISREVAPLKRWRIYVSRGLRYVYGRLTAVRRLERTMDLSTVDIVHSNSSREDLGALIAKKHRIPLIWHIREFGDLDFSCYSYRYGYIRFMNKRAARMLAVSDAVRRSWIDRGIAPEKIKTVYNGVDDAVAAKETACRNKEQQTRFLMMGSVSDTKGQWQVIDALGRMDKEQRADVLVDIVGGVGKQYQEKLCQKIHAFGLDGHVRFLGYQKDYYRAACQYDCGLMCSRAEGFGRVTAEYMMAGIPVIASDAGANPELVTNGENGLLYRWADVDDLKEKMLWMCRHPKERERMGTTARRHAAERFSAKRNAQAVFQEYETLMRSRETEKKR